MTSRGRSGATKRRTGLVLAALAALSVAALEARAQDGPSRPVRIVVPFAPGGVTDTVARLSAEWLRAELKQSAVVENKPGANGLIAMETVARGPADGTSLLTASASQMVMLPALKKLDLDPATAFAPVSIVASNPMVLAVSSKLGVDTLPDFLQLVRAKPGRLDYAIAGAGSSTHLAMALLLARAGAEMQAVPYRGGAPSMQALLSGDVAAYFGNPNEIIPHAGGQIVKVLAVAGPERLPGLPNVPTVAEQGFPGFRAETWNGLAAPAGTPEPILRRLADAMGRACADPTFRATLEKAGTTPVCGTPDAFRRTMEADAPLWREAVRLSGAQLE